LDIIAKLAATRLVTAGPRHSSRVKSAPGWRAGEIGDAERSKSALSSASGSTSATSFWASLGWRRHSPSTAQRFRHWRSRPCSPACGSPACRKN